MIVAPAVPCLHLVRNLFGDWLRELYWPPYGDADEEPHFFSEIRYDALILSCVVDGDLSQDATFHASAIFIGNVG